MKECLVIFNQTAAETGGKTGSMLTVYFSLLFLLVLGSMDTLKGQTWVGTWYDSQYQAKMVLFNNGTYTLQYPNGASQGRFNFNGNVFCLQDASGANPICYTVDKVDGSQLVLRDINGVTLHYQLQTTGKTPAMETKEAKVLAQKGAFSLTTAHLEAGVGLVQFIIGKAIKKSEVKELETKLIEEFNSAPDQVLQQLTSLSESLKKIRGITDPLQIGYARQQLFVALYQGTSHLKEAEKPLLIQVMNRYIKVLATDPANALVLTDKDVEGMVRYLAFNSELQGLPVQLTAELFRSYTAELVKGFAVMPVEQKRFLCSASLVWQLLEYNWNRLNASQKQQYKNTYMARGQKTNPGSQSHPATPYANPGTGGNANTAAAMRDYQARQNMYRIMNNVNLNSHALGLNIIENMGGTGNYWNVVDY